jgi:hypothetical protein
MNQPKKQVGAPACHRKARRMSTAKEYRVKAAEYAGLAETAHSSSECRELRALERNCNSLAANKEWLAGNDDQAVPASWKVDHALTTEEQILGRLGAALVMRWSTLPKKIQRDLFEYAGSIGDPQQTTELKERMARFLHNRKGDAHKSVAHLP